MPSQVPGSAAAFHNQASANLWRGAASAEADRVGLAADSITGDPLKNRIQLGGHVVQFVRRVRCKHRMGVR